MVKKNCTNYCTWKREEASSGPGLSLTGLSSDLDSSAAVSLSESSASPRSQQNEKIRQTPNMRIKFKSLIKCFYSQNQSINNIN